MLQRVCDQQSCEFHYKWLYFFSSLDYHLVRIEAVDSRNLWLRESENKLKQALTTFYEIQIEISSKRRFLQPSVKNSGWIWVFDWINSRNDLEVSI